MIIMARKHVRRLTGSRRWQQAQGRSNYDPPSVPDVLMSVIMTQAETPVEETVMADGMRGNGGARGGKM